MKTRLIKVLALTIPAATVFFFAACKGGPEQVIARVGGMKITQADFNKKIMEIAPEYQSYLLTSNGRKQFLDILIREKLILAAARSSPAAKSEKYKSEIKNMEQEFETRLGEFKDYILTKMWIDGLKADGSILAVDGEIQEYHKKHHTEVLLDHILLAAPEEAEIVMRKVRSGAGFAAMAKAKSLDAETAGSGGKIAPFIHGEFLPDLEDAAFKMKTGETQGVVKSKFGYHVLKKNGERDIVLNDSAKTRIRRLLEKNKLDAYLEKLQSNYKVEVLDEQFIRR